MSNNDYYCKVGRAITYQGAIEKNPKLVKMYNFIALYIV